MNGNIRTKIQTIEDDKEMMAASCDRMKNGLTGTEKYFEVMQENKNVINYSEKLIDNNIKTEKVKFDINHGHKDFGKLNELSDLLIEKCELYGYGENEINIIKDKKENIKTSSEMEQLIQSLNGIIDRNQKNIKLYFQNIELMENVSSNVFNQSTHDVISQFLAANDIRLSQYYNEINIRKGYQNVGGSFEQNLENINPSIHRADNKNVNLEEIRSKLYSSEFANSKCNIKAAVRNAIRENTTNFDLDKARNAETEKKFVKKKKVIKGMD